MLKKIGGGGVALAAVVLGGDVGGQVSV
jgi:hypothetical protein